MKRIDLIYWLCVDDASLIHWDAYNDRNVSSLPSNSIAGGGAGLMVAGWTWILNKKPWPHFDKVICAMVKLHALLHLKNNKKGIEISPRLMTRWPSPNMDIQSNLSPWWQYTHKSMGKTYDPPKNGWFTMVNTKNLPIPGSTSTERPVSLWQRFS